MRHGPEPGRPGWPARRGPDCGYGCGCARSGRGRGGSPRHLNAKVTRVRDIRIDEHDVDGVVVAEAGRMHVTVSAGTACAVGAVTDGIGERLADGPAQRLSERQAVEDRQHDSELAPRLGKLAHQDRGRQRGDWPRVRGVGQVFAGCGGTRIFVKLREHGSCLLRREGFLDPAGALARHGRVALYVLVGAYPDRASRNSSGCCRTPANAALTASDMLTLTSTAVVAATARLRIASRAFGVTLTAMCPCDGTAPPFDVVTGQVSRGGYLSGTVLVVMDALLVH